MRLPGEGGIHADTRVSVAAVLLRATTTSAAMDAKACDVARSVPAGAGMSLMTVAAALALATQCIPAGSAVDPAMIVGIAQRESGLDPAAIRHNTNGTTDVGLMQLNSANFGLLGLDTAAALDPCQSIAGAIRLLEMFSRYNTGSATRGIANGYAGAVLTRVHALKAGLSAPSLAPSRASDPDPASIVATPGAGYDIVIVANTIKGE